MLDINRYSFIFTFINIIVLFMILKKFLIGPVTAIMEKREDKINSTYQEISQAKQQAEEIKKTYEQSLQDVHVEAERIRKDAKDTAAKEHEKVLAKAQEEAKMIVSTAKKTALMEQEKTMREIESEIAGLAMAAVSKILEEQNTTQWDGIIYNQFLAKAGESYDTNSN